MFFFPSVFTDDNLQQMPLTPGKKYTVSTCITKQVLSKLLNGKTCFLHFYADDTHHPHHERPVPLPKLLHRSLDATVSMHFKVALQMDMLYATMKIYIF